MSVQEYRAHTRQLRRRAAVQAIACLTLGGGSGYLALSFPAGLWAFLGWFLVVVNVVYAACALLAWRITGRIFALLDRIEQDRETDWDEVFREVRKQRGKG